MNKRRRTRGMVTLELAIGIMSAAMVLFGASAVIGMLILQDRIESVASQAARFSARGDEAELAKVRKKAPRGATITVQKSGGWAVAKVRAERSWGRLGPFELQAEASAPLEPGE